MLGWIRERRRKSIRQTAFPRLWMEYLAGSVPQYTALSPEDREKLQGDLRIFMSEKDWEGGRGFQVTDEMKVVVSALACLLILHLDNDYYPNVQTVILYESSYIAPRREVLPGGAVMESREPRGGEAHGIGPIVLSWSEIVEGAARPGSGENLVLHEFAHKLDFVDGRPDGVPRLFSDELYTRWAEVMSEEYLRLARAVESGRGTLLDRYGATDSAEFFAVCTEAFFEMPLHLEREHPKLYATLSAYYRQNPASWFAAG